LLAVANAGTTEDMARRKTPELSSITRTHTVAYSRKQKPDGTDADDEPAPSDADVVKAALATMKLSPSDGPEIKAPSDGRAQTVVPDAPTAKVDNGEDLVRARVATVGMPLVVHSGFGFPPEMPVEVASPVKGGVVEDPTHMPGPRDIPSGSPDDLAPPPGHVPPGDSRSLRRRTDSYDFALIYRLGNAVISRVGIVGTRGVWRVVEYPTTASASHAYAKEASRFVSDGFSDYRE
jgi:hypothetical protein